MGQILWQRIAHISTMKLDKMLLAPLGLCFSALSVLDAEQEKAVKKPLPMPEVYTCTQSWGLWGRDQNVD